jgi:hypothetical protein
MRRPNAAAGRGASEHEPSMTGPRSRSGGAGAMEQAYSDEAREQANKPCQHHEPPVMLAREARKHTEHSVADLSLFTKNLADYGFISRYARGTKLIQPCRGWSTWGHLPR